MIKYCVVARIGSNLASIVVDSWFLVDYEPSKTRHFVGVVFWGDLEIDVVGFEVLYQEILAIGQKKTKPNTVRIRFWS